MRCASLHRLWRETILVCRIRLRGLCGMRWFGLNPQVVCPISGNDTFVQYPNGEKALLEKVLLGCLGIRCECSRAAQFVAQVARAVSSLVNPGVAPLNPL